jgi:hypothetical protein
MLKIMRIFWELMNVKNPTKGLNTNLPEADAWTADNLEQRIEWLEAFIRWLDEWEAMVGKAFKLSADTFWSLRQQARAMVCVCVHYPCLYCADLLPHDSVIITHSP